MVWWYVAVLVVSHVVSHLLAPKPDQPKAAGLQDIQAPTADENRPIPVLFGSKLIKGPNVVWYGHLRVQAVKKRGGKK